MRVRSIAALAVFTAAAITGLFLAAAWLTPERLRLETEQRLSRALKTSVSIGSVRPSFRGGLGLEGHASRR